MRPSDDLPLQFADVFWAVPLPLKVSSRFLLLLHLLLENNINDNRGRRQFTSKGRLGTATLQL